MQNVTHKIIKEKDGEFILRTFMGKVTTEHIMDSFVYILNNNMISPECKGILTDLRGAELAFDMNSFHNLLIFIKSSSRLLSLKIAVVVDSSDKIVFPMMASNDPGLKVQPFSTIDVARGWILE